MNDVPQGGLQVRRGKLPKVSSAGQREAFAMAGNAPSVAAKKAAYQILIMQTAAIEKLARASGTGKPKARKP